MSFSTTVNSIFDAIKANWQKVDLKKWSQDIGGSSAEAVHAALYFVLAFGIGFTLKKYFKFMVSGFIIALILIKLLEYNGIITINWATFKAVTGIGSAADLNTVANTFIGWVKKNIFLFGAAVVGILLGYRLG